MPRVAGKDLRHSIRTVNGKITLTITQNMMKPLNIIFAGTPDFAAQHLHALLNSSHNVIGVYTQPDKPAGRGKKLQASPVKQLAEQHQIPVYQPKSLRKPETQAELRALNADVMVVVAYGLILVQEMGMP